MSEEKAPIDTKWLMDRAAKVAYLLNTSRGRFETKRSQLFRLVEVLEGTTDAEEALLATALFAIRQSKRRDREASLIPPNVATAIRDVLLDIAEKTEEKARIKDLAREFLGYLRWFFEASENVRLPRVRLEDVNARWLLSQLGRKTIT